MPRLIMRACRPVCRIEQQTQAVYRVQKLVHDVRIFGRPPMILDQYFDPLGSCAGNQVVVAFNYDIPYLIQGLIPAPGINTYLGCTQTFGHIDPAVSAQAIFNPRFSRWFINVRTVDGDATKW